MSSPRLVPIVALAAAALALPATASANLTPYSTEASPDASYGTHDDGAGNQVQNWTSDNILGPNEDVNVSFPFMDSGVDDNGNPLDFAGGTGLLSRTDDSDVSIVTTTRPFSANNGGTVTNAPNYFQLHTGASLVCGTTVGLRLDLSSVAQSQFNKSYNFTLPTGVRGAYHRTPSTTVGQVVTDGGTIQSPVEVTGQDGRAKGIRVHIDSLEHRFSTYWLEVTLIAPSGKKVVLMDHEGSLDSNTASRPKTLTNVTFSDSPIGGQVPKDSGEALDASYTNIVMQPKEKLSALDGEPTNGVWKLQVHDISQPLTNRSSRGRSYSYSGNEMAQLGEWQLDTTSALCSGTPQAWFGEGGQLVLNPAGGTLDASASYDPSLGGSIVSYLWDLNGDGTFETTTSTPTVPYPATTSAPYTHDISLKVVDNQGNTSPPVTRTAIFSNKPVVSGVSLTPANPVAGQEAQLSASATDSDAGDTLTYAWDLDGDGVYDNGTGTNPKYTWQMSGPQVVRLKVTDSRGAATYYWQTLSIANTNPVARASYSPTPAVVGQPVTLDGSTSTDADGTVVSYSWDLDGNGTTDDYMSDKPTVTKTFTEPGSHIVRLVVTDNTGGQDTASLEIWVTGPPVGVISATPTSPLVGETVTFSAAQSHDSDAGGSIVKYEWDLDGNGSYEVSGATAVSATKSYPNPGTVSVRLRLTDNDGATSVTPFAVVVRSAATPTPAPTATPKPTPTPTPVPGANQDPGTVVKTPIVVDGGGVIKNAVVQDTGKTEGDAWWNNDDDSDSPSATLDGFSASITATAKQKAKKAYKNGVAVKLTATAAGKIAVKATIDKKSAKALKINAKTNAFSVGSGTLAIKKGGAFKFVVKFNKKYAAKLKKAKSLTVMLRGLVTSKDGTKLTVQKKITIVK